MFHRPPRPRARHGTPSGSPSPGSGRTSAARFFVSGGSAPPIRHPVPTTRHRCRHARSTDSPAIRGRTRSSRRPWRGRRAAEPAARARRGRIRGAAAVAFGGPETRTGRPGGRPAWEFGEGARREGVSPSGTGSETIAPPALRPGGAIFVCGLAAGRGGERRRTERNEGGWPAGARPEARRTRLPVPGRSAPPRHPPAGGSTNTAKGPAAPAMEESHTGSRGGRASPPPFARTPDRGTAVAVRHRTERER